jgi:hypothetical protein
MDFRVRVMMERLGRNDADALREAIERFDAARARTLRAYFNVEEEDARFYDIMLNTERLSVDACVNAVCKLAEGPRFRDTFTSRSALSNKLPEAKISSALVEHISVAMAPLGLSVSVANGKVTLARTTCSGSLRNRAEKITRAVAGVFQIDSCIISRPTRYCGIELGDDGFGVFLGAKIALQDRICNPGNPASSAVGISGAVGRRAALSRFGRRRQAADRLPCVGHGRGAKKPNPMNNSASAMMKTK